MPELRLKLMGSPIFEIDSAPVEVSSRKPAALLAHLAVGGQPVSRDSLATMFWPDQDQSRARAYLRNALYMLTQAGFAPWMDVGRESVSMAPPYSLDTAEFEQCIQAARQHDHAADAACEACAAQLEQAAALYRGDFMDGFSLPDCPEYDSWQFYQSDRLRRLLDDSLEKLVRFYDRRSDWERAAAHARRWASLDPLNEGAQRWLMRLYAQSGKRALALKQYDLLSSTLEKELGAAPEAETSDLYQQIQAQRSAESAPPAAAPAVKFERPRHNLPAELTSFIGREREIAEIEAVLRPDGSGAPSARLLTLTGPGGSGKTRLAIRVAARLSGMFAHGAAFVGLAAVDNPGMAAAAIASSLGFVEAPGKPILETLKDGLKSRRLLLVLDNFEHLIDAAPLVSELLAAAPDVTVLATSREILHVYGEQVYPVPPLALPPPSERNQPVDVTAYEAVQMFIDRAKAVQPGIEIGPQEAAVAAEICALLDGLPLAIELAAARLRLFSLQSLHDKISGRFEVLRGGPRDVPSRQRTLRAAIDWSFNLLDAAEQRLFARLSIFQNTFSLEAVEQVCGVEDRSSVLDDFESLIEKSLVIQAADLESQPRFRMLRTIHAYAREKLEEMGEIEAMSARHARYYLDLAERSEQHTRGGAQILGWLNRLQGEIGNLRAALDWSLSGGDALLGMRTASALVFFWVRRDHHSEGRAYLERALSLSGGAPTALKAKLHLTAGVLAYFREDLAACLEIYRQSVELFRQIEEPGGLGWALVFYGGTLAMVHDERYDEALALCDEGMAIMRQTGDRPGIAQALNFVGEMARIHGDLPFAKALYEECLAISREIGDQMREMMVYNNLIYVAMREGDYARAGELFRPGVRLAIAIQSASQLASFVMTLAGLKAAQHEARSGALLMGAAQAILDASGLVHQPADRVEIEQYKANLQALLGDDAYETAVQEGYQMPMEDLVALALA